MRKTDYRTFLPAFEGVASRGTGINFTLLMAERPEKTPEAIYYSDKYFREMNLVTVSIHPRWNQPCYGEMRKYKSTHGDECTQPENEKPTDLWHPFPKGTPCAIASNIGELDPLYRETIFSSDSPWKDGISKLKISGDTIIMQSTNLDPTILVNLLNTVKAQRHNQGTFTSLTDDGMDPRLALLVMRLNGDGECLPRKTDTYMCTEKFSVRRFLDSHPHDLSGGLLRDRIDYNRTYIQNLFLGDGDFIWERELEKANLVKPGSSMYAHKEWTTKGKELVQALSSLLTDAYTRECEKGPIINVPWHENELNVLNTKRKAA